MLHKDFLDRVDVNFAWGLIESFATQPREAPDDANRGAELIAERLKSAGIPVTMHRPTLFLSLPGPASVEIGGQRYRAKPPAFSASVPQGVTAPMEYFAPTKREFARHQKLDPNRFRGKIVVTEGISLPMLTSEIEEMGALGIMATNPGERIHWSTASTIWGTPGVEDMNRLPKIPSLAVNRSRRRRGAGGREARRDGDHPHRAAAGLVSAEPAGGAHRRRERAGPLRVPARPLRQLAGRRRRQRHRQCLHGRDRARAVGAAQEPAPLGAARLVAGAFDRPLRRQRLVSRPARDGFRQELRDAHELRQPGLPLGDRIHLDHHDARDREVGDARWSSA